MKRMLGRAIIVAAVVGAALLLRPASPLAAGETGKGAFETQHAFDALLAKQGRRSLEGADNGDLAWGESYVMMGLVTMYHATGERRYLDALIEHADAVLARRDSVTGTKDYRGRSLPGWSTGGAYSIGEVRLKDARGVPTLYLRSAMTGSNDETKVIVTPGKAADTFTLLILNEKYKQQDRFEDLTMDPATDHCAVTRIHASKLAQPFSYMRLHARDLGSSSQGAARNPAAVATTMEPSRYLWPVHQGMIFEPLTLFARTVRETEALRGSERYRLKADAYLAAAEALFRALEAGWRENTEGEGWYAIEKGAPVWMDGCDEPHNHYLAVGNAMLHAAAATGNPLWRERVTRMARTLRNDMRYMADADSYVWPYWWGKGKAYKGWGPDDSVAQNTPGLEPRPSMEDVSHGSIDVNFACYCFRDGLVFTRQDMERLANTFMKNIVRRKADGALTFADRVDGTGSDGRYDLQGPAWPLLSEFRPEILDVFREMRSQSPWNGYAVWLLQSANMNLVRVRLATGEVKHAHH